MLYLSRSHFRAVHLFMMTSLQGLTLNSASYWMRSLQACSRLSCSCCTLEHTRTVTHDFKTLLKEKKKCWRGSVDDDRNKIYIFQDSCRKGRRQKDTKRETDEIYKKWGRKRITEMHHNRNLGSAGGVFHVYFCLFCSSDISSSCLSCRTRFSLSAFMSHSSRTLLSTSCTHLLTLSWETDEGNKQSDSRFSEILDSDWSDFKLGRFCFFNYLQFIY